MLVALLESNVSLSVELVVKNVALKWKAKVHVAHSFTSLSGLESPTMGRFHQNSLDIGNHKTLTSHRNVNLPYFRTL